MASGGAQAGSPTMAVFAIVGVVAPESSHLAFVAEEAQGSSTPPRLARLRSE